MTERRGAYRGLARGLAVAGMPGAVLAAITSCSAHGPAGPVRPPTHSASGPPTATPTALPQASCGAAATHDLSSITQVFRADTGALSCFATAARQCASASIAVTEMGVDAGTGYVFAVVPGKARCQATEWSQFYSASSGGTKYGKVVVTQCSATAGPDGVLLGCDGQDILIPAAVNSSATALDP